MDNPPYLTIMGAADHKWIVAYLEYVRKEDDYYITKTSNTFQSRLEALRFAVDWADADKLEIR